MKHSREKNRRVKLYLWKCSPRSYYTPWLEILVIQITAKGLFLGTKLLISGPPQEGQ